MNTKIPHVSGSVYAALWSTTCSALAAMVLVLSLLSIPVKIKNDKYAIEFHVVHDPRINLPCNGIFGANIHRCRYFRFPNFWNFRNFLQ